MGEQGSFFSNIKDAISNSISIQIFLIVITIMFVSMISLAIFIFKKSLIDNKNNRIIEQRANGILARFSGMSLVFATSISISGAFATIYTAELGLQVARTTLRVTTAADQREDTKFIEERLEKSINLYGSILEEISQLYASEIYFEAGVSSEATATQKHDCSPTVNDGKCQNHNDVESLPDRLKHISFHLKALSDALRATSRDEFSAVCFKTSWNQQEKSRIDSINRQLSDDKDLGLHLSLADLADIASLFDNASNDANGSPDNFKDISGSEDQNPAQKIENLRSDQIIDMNAYIKLGNIILNPYFFSKKFRVLYGLAVIRDLVKNTPTGSDIVACFRKSYADLFERNPDIQSDLEKIKIRTIFDSSAIIGDKLNSIIDKFDESVNNYLEVIH